MSTKNYHKQYNKSRERAVLTKHYKEVQEIYNKKYKFLNQNYEH